MILIYSSDNIEEPPVQLRSIGTIILRDDIGNPVFIARQQDNGAVWAVTPADSNFEEVARDLGLVDRLVVVRGKVSFEER